jgi:hypothetical protein
MVDVTPVTANRSRHHINHWPEVPCCIWEMGTGREGVMVRQDYLFMMLLFMILFLFGHWGGMHFHFRH